MFTLCDCGGTTKATIEHLSVERSKRDHKIEANLIERRHSCRDCGKSESRLYSGTRQVKVISSITSEIEL